jgi:hypothetical protein
MGRPHRGPKPPKTAKVLSWGSAPSKFLIRGGLGRGDENERFGAASYD